MRATLRLILGDQLSRNLASLQDADPAQDVLMLCEVMDEATYVPHHPKKIALLFSAMRHFAESLRQEGFTVDYVPLDAPENSGSLTGEIMRAIARHQPEKLILTFPGEWRVWRMMQQWQEQVGLPVEIREDTRFFCTRDRFQHWAATHKTYRMEFFYREMRRQHGILMRGDMPEGGQWNYDVENRNPPKQGLQVPPTYHEPPDQMTQQVLTLVRERFGHHFGELEPFHFAVTRQGALAALNRFIQQRLPMFGAYQDAMLMQEPWMYHAHISFYLNCGLLDARECVTAAEQAYHAGDAPLNAVEGFIRQILGWREYVRGIYWLHMPDYAQMNQLQATRPLPDLYWTGRTRMQCMRQCVEATRRYAYAHHIQRLMVLGNFALLAGLHPEDVNRWYLLVYADAFEWVELPNVTGMVLHADGGMLASKPYAAGGAYIHKMSDYCQSCSYKVAVKHGTSACPFNYLYWDFLLRHRERFQCNPRMAMVYRTLDRMTPERQQTIRQDAARFLTAMDNGELI